MVEINIAEFWSQRTLSLVQTILAWRVIFTFFLCVNLCHLYATGGEVRVLEFVLSRAACFCFLSITSWSFCFTRELATAPANQQHNETTEARINAPGSFRVTGGVIKKAKSTSDPRGLFGQHVISNS